MKKLIKVENLDCANCARKLEEKLQKLEGVNDCKVSFMNQKITIDIQDDKSDEIFEEIIKVCKTTEPDMKIV